VPFLPRADKNCANPYTTTIHDHIGPIPQNSIYHK